MSHSALKMHKYIHFWHKINRYNYNVVVPIYFVIKPRTRTNICTVIHYHSCCQTKPVALWFSVQQIYRRSLCPSMPLLRATIARSLHLTRTSWWVLFGYHLFGHQCLCNELPLQASITRLQIPLLKVPALERVPAGRWNASQLHNVGMCEMVSSIQSQSCHSKHPS